MRAFRHERRNPSLTALVKRVLIVGGALALAGCATRGGNVPYEPTGFVAPDVQGQVVADMSRPIGALIAGPVGCC